MSVPFSGVLTRSGGISAAIARQLENLSLKPVKKVVIKFDPFHHQVEETRQFLFHLSSPKVLKTNLNCVLKPEIVCDRSDPQITFKLGTGDEVVFKSANLTALEMVNLFNKHITVLAPKEDTTVIATKSSKVLGKPKPAFKRK